MEEGERATREGNREGRPFGVGQAHQKKNSSNGFFPMGDGFFPKSYKRRKNDKRRTPLKGERRWGGKPQALLSSSKRGLNSICNAGEKKALGGGGGGGTSSSSSGGSGDSSTQVVETPNSQNM